MAPGDIRPSTDFVGSPSLADPKWYSHAVSVSGPSRLVFTSGQVGQLQDGTWPSDFAGQVKQAVLNLEAALKAAGASPRDIIKLTFYGVDWSMDLSLALVKPILKLLTEDFGVSYRPITTLVPVPKLAFPEAKFEIEGIAAIGGGLARPWKNGSVEIELPVAPDEVDVLVVGGGFSGLRAASLAQKAGLKVVLLEAKHRVGGRSRTQQLKSGPGLIEMGATWINKTTQPTVYALAQEFGLEMVPQYVIGDGIFQDQEGNIMRAPDGDITNISDPETQAKLISFITAINTESEALDIRNFDYPADKDISVSEWVEKNGLKSPLIDGLTSHLVSALVGREPEETGVHYLLDYIKSGCGYASIASEGELGAQSLKIKQGTSAIATGLAASMEPGSIVLHSPVDSISQYGNGTIVTTATGSRFKAKKVILANPTNTYGYIQFSPPLPVAKKALVSRTMPGIYAKVIITYRSAWWKEAGLVGKFTSLKGPICFSWDISDASLQQYSLAFFVAGKRAVSWHQLTELGREEAIINHLAELVGPDLREKAVDILEFNVIEWTKEDFLYGAPTSAMGPGQLSKYGSALRESYLNIHFAGGETAYEWKGYLEGAITAGERAAEEVIKILTQGREAGAVAMNSA